MYAVEKNPYAMNTLVHRNKYEWDSQVTLVKDDMRNWQAPELADILISELLGLFDWIIQDYFILFFFLKDHSETMNCPQSAWMGLKGS